MESIMSTAESDLSEVANGNNPAASTSAPQDEPNDCLAQAQLNMPWLDFNARLHVKGGKNKKEKKEPNKSQSGGFRLPGLTIRKKEKDKEKDKDKDKNKSKSEESSKSGTTPEDWHDLSIPKKKQIWNGWDGMATTAAGIAMPSLMILATFASAPKRITLVLLNHPIETLLELGLIMGIPLVNYLVWSGLCKNNYRFPLWRGFGLGSAIATSLITAGVCIAAIFAGQDMASEIGTDFALGFTWMAMLALLAGAASLYLANRVRLTRDFAKSRMQIVTYTIMGAAMAILTFLGSEARPWYVRMAEAKAVSNSAKERKEGMQLLHSLNPERSLLMECSDSRAAGLCGMFIPIKSSAEHQLYFALTGKPYSFKDITNEDLSSMPDDYLSRHVVGEKVKGLSMTRSYLTGLLHPSTLSSTVEWTFVFKNQTDNPQEARAEIGLPPGAVITGLTVWNNGEPQDATFAAAGKAIRESDSTTYGSNDNPGMVTDLGHGRVLIHCYPVTADEELKARVTLVVPLKPDGATGSTLALPRILATNFDLTGDHLIRMRSNMALGSTAKSLTAGVNPDGTKAISGTLTQDQLENANLLVTAQRAPLTKPIAVLDKLAIKLQQEEEKRLEEIKRKKMHAAKAAAKNEPVIVMIEGATSKGIQLQIDELKKALADKHSKQSANKKVVKPKIKTIKPIYVVESINKVAAPAPKNLLVVVDGSTTMNEYKGDVLKALQQIPSGVPTKVIIASSDKSTATEAMPLQAALARIDANKFEGGQDNLQSVVKASELAGETKGGAVLWLHGPQPVLNQEIYIMPPYVAVPTFYEMPVGAGDTDTYDYFKNHTEIGPFSQVPRSSNSIAEDLASFFSKWKVNENGYAVALQTKSARPADCQPATADEGRELMALHANQVVSDLLLNRHARKAGKIAVAYGLVSPVSCALVMPNNNNETEADEPGTTGNDEGLATNNGENGENVNAENQNADKFAEESPAVASSEAAAGEAAGGAGAAGELQGATNGTIGPQGTDATYVTGVNTAGTVRVNNLANLEALLNIIANLCETGLSLVGVIIVLHSMVNRSLAIEVMGQEVEIGQGQRIAFGLGLLLVGLAFPGLVNWFVASARDANLFS
jgi:hypothetical protein